MTEEKTAAQGAGGQTVSALHKEWQEAQMVWSSPRGADAATVARIKRLERAIAATSADFVAEVVLKLTLAVSDHLAAGEWKALVHSAIDDLKALDHPFTDLGSKRI